MSSTQNKPRNNQLILSQSESVRLFIKDTGIPFNRAPEALGVKASDFLDWWSGNKPKLIQYKQLNALAQFLRIDEDEIIEGTYNKDHIRTILFSGPSILPDKYLQNQFSCLRSSAHIIKFLTLTRGQHFSDMIMRKLNIGPLIYKDLNSKISLNYFIDLLEILAENGLKQSELDNLACVLFLSLGDTPLGEKFKQAKSYYECYEILTQNIQLFDSNFTYSFELDRRHVRAHTVLHFDTHSHIDWSRVKVHRLLRYRQFFVCWLPYLAKLSPIFPQHSVVFYKDRIETKYTINFRDKSINPLFCIPQDRQIHFE